MRGSTCTIDARALDAANTRSFSDGTTRASAVPRPSIDEAAVIISQNLPFLWVTVRTK